MVNAHFECKHISQFKRLIDVFNYWKWKDKEMVNLKEEMLIQLKPEHHLVIWIIIESIKHGFRFGLYEWQAKT